MSNATPPIRTLPSFLRNPAVRIVIGMLAVLVPTAILQFGITALPIDRLPRNILLGLLTPPVIFWAYATFVRLTEQRAVSELGRQGALSEFGIGLLGGAVLAVLVFGILAFFGAYKVTGTNGLEVLLVPLFGWIASAVLEEVLFRGILFRIMEQALGSWLGLALSAMVFGGLHLLNANATVMGAVSVMLTAGLLLAAAFMLTRRLWLPIGIHYAWNFLQSAVFGGVVSGTGPSTGLFQSRLDGPDWLTGGVFGAEASVVIVVLAMVGTALILTRVVKSGSIVPPPWRRSRI